MPTIQLASLQGKMDNTAWTSFLQLATHAADRPTLLNPEASRLNPGASSASAASTAGGSAPGWLSGDSWQAACTAEAVLPSLKGFCASLSDESDTWQAAMTETADHVMDAVPGSWATVECISRLAIIQCIRCVGQFTKLR